MYRVAALGLLELLGWGHVSCEAGALFSLMRWPASKGTVMVPYGSQ